MKKLAPFLLVFGLLAADPWQSKPFTEWSDKEIQKLLTNSPWSKTVSIAASDATDSGSAPGRGGRGFGADDAPQRAGGAEQMPGASSGAPGGNIASRNVDLDTPGGSSIPLTVIWESALPVKQALARRKYGSEAGTSPDAKKFLDENSSYLIAVAGIPRALVRAPQTKASILQGTSLTAKGKEPLHPSDIQNGPPGKEMEAVFIFPKTTTFGMDDKEVEFSTRLGSAVIKCRFRLKDMQYQGKLEL